jgi:regulator of PEP synthase PpsR (kinase-PPPase family)
MKVKENVKGPPIFIVSGGTGAAGELLTRTVLAQFPGVKTALTIEPHVYTDEQLDVIVANAGAAGGVIVHTLVDHGCRQKLLEATARAGVWQFDLAGPLLNYLAGVLQQEPVGQPGLYRRLHQSYFNRIEAIEFAVAHDDGKRIDEIKDAEIVLVGVSRVGKTPLSMYLSFQGWKVANVPFVPGVPLPDELREVHPGRLVGIVVDPSQLIQHRQTRLLHVGGPNGSYVDRTAVVEELRAVKHYFASSRIPIVDASEKPIESSADEVIKLVTRRVQQVK